MDKKCSKCGATKPLLEFYKDAKAKDGHSCWCIDCHKAKKKKYYSANSAEIKRKNYEYRQANYAKVREQETKRYYRPDQVEHRKLYREKTKEHRKKKIKAWKENNKERVREYNRWYYRKNPTAHMRQRVRRLVRRSIVNKTGRAKSSRTKDIVGCDLDFLCEYLSKTWERNYGKPWNGEPYHIDHIIPLATAKTEEEVRRLCHYTNLQLLTPEDNMAKGDKITTLY